MLVELGVVEQRYRAVLEVFDGASVVEVARRNGVTRQTVHEWLRRYANGGGLGGSGGSVVAAGVVSASDAGARLRRGSWRCGGRIRGGGRTGSAGSWVVTVWCRCRAGRRCIGRWCVTVWWMRRSGGAGGRTIGGGSGARSMELWQMDVMGRVHLADGRECKVVTGIDDHSRFVVCAKVVAPGDGAAGVRGVGRGAAPARGAGADPDRQREGVHGAVRAWVRGR